MDKKLKGIAMILFAILIAQSPATNTNLPYILAVLFGLYGTLIVLLSKE